MIPEKVTFFFLFLRDEFFVFCGNVEEILCDEFIDTDGDDLSS